MLTYTDQKAKRAEEKRRENKKAKAEAAPLYIVNRVEHGPCIHHSDRLDRLEFCAVILLLQCVAIGMSA